MEQDHTERFQELCKNRHYEPSYGYWDTIQEGEIYGGKILNREIDKCFKDAKDSKEKLAELSLVLWLKYELYDEASDEPYSDLYYKKYTEVDLWACNHLDENDIIYYLRRGA